MVLMIMPDGTYAALPKKYADKMRRIDAARDKYFAKLSALVKRRTDLVSKFLAKADQDRMDSIRRALK